ncbi:hypothetical protein DFH27DRAFT_121037 [Peziza echinospora]|nr:hypothetical protein DFH27DRAFT_121037 [Peziza echinospora]
MFGWPGISERYHGGLVVAWLCGLGVYGHGMRGFRNWDRDIYGFCHFCYGYILDGIAIGMEVWAWRSYLVGNNNWGNWSGHETTINIFLIFFFFVFSFFKNSC